MHTMDTTAKPVTEMWHKKLSSLILADSHICAIVVTTNSVLRATFAQTKSV